VLLTHNAFGSSWDPYEIGTPRFDRQYPRHADYVGLCAVERERIVSSVVVHRFPFRTRERNCICSGLGAVATLPAFTRRGLARRLIEEVHRRERESGSPFVLLYTGRSIVAHALYESLGYRDVLLFPRAVRWVPKHKRTLPRGWRWRRATLDDRQAIEELRKDLGRARLGFTREGVEWWPGPEKWFASGPESWFVLERDRSICAYANLRTEGQLRACHEGMARTTLARRYLLSSLESEASGGWLLLGSPLIYELRQAPGIRAYILAQGSHSVLMAKSLDGFLRPSDLAHELGTDRPDFLIGVADSF
jgi:GNAT superfamily N-acetyltransferase